MILQKLKKFDEYLNKADQGREFDTKTSNNNERKL